MIAMLTAQNLNKDGKPIYGCYIIGRMWNFMVLEDKNYCISKSFNADDDEVFEIFRIMKGLKFLLEKQI